MQWSPLGIGYGFLRGIEVGFQGGFATQGFPEQRPTMTREDFPPRRTLGLARFKASSRSRSTIPDWEARPF
jgi:hypothetical protein